MRDITKRAIAGCPVEVAITIIGGCWKLTIVQHLLQGSERYGALKRSLGEVSDRTMIRQLRELEADGIVHREVFPEVPPRVEYSLTPLGLTLEPLVGMVDSWGKGWLAEQRAAEQRGTGTEPAVSLRAENSPVLSE